MASAPSLLMWERMQASFLLCLCFVSSETGREEHRAPVPPANEPEGWQSLLSRSLPQAYLRAQRPSVTGCLQVLTDCDCHFWKSGLGDLQPFPLSPAAVGGGLVFLGCPPASKRSCRAGQCQAGQQQEERDTSTTLPGDTNTGLLNCSCSCHHTGAWFPVSEI